jgi:hypothetical protein
MRAFVEQVVAQYEDLIEKAQGFADMVMRRRADAFACRAGCEACCHVELTVSQTEARRVRAALEALDAPTRTEIAARAHAHTGRCVMLDDEGRCSVYASRPLVCRTQGLALGYPKDVVPVSAVRFRSRALEVVACPLNFTGRGPEDEDVLDAGRLDAMLALVSRLEGDDDPDDRVALRTLAALP